MSKHYLSLVLVEVPDHVEETPYAAWFHATSIYAATVKDGLLEIVFTDGTIKVFNEDESEDIVDNCGEILQRAIWKENPIPGSTLDNLINEN